MVEKENKTKKNNSTGRVCPSVRLSSSNIEYTMVSGGRIALLLSLSIVKIRVLDDGILRVLLGPSVDSEHHRYKQALFAPLVSSCLAQRQWYLKGHVSASQMTPGYTGQKYRFRGSQILGNPCKSLEPSCPSHRAIRNYPGRVCPGWPGAEHEFSYNPPFHHAHDCKSL